MHPWARLASPAQGNLPASRASYEGASGLSVPLTVLLHPQRNLKGLTITENASKPGVAAAHAGGAKKVGAGAGRLNADVGSDTSSLSLPTDASSSASSSPSLPSSAFSSSAGSSGPPGGAGTSSYRNSSTQAYHSKLTEQLANLEIGVEFKLELRAEDLEVVKEVGHGNGGTVSRVRHVPTGALMARKVGSGRRELELRSSGSDA